MSFSSAHVETAQQAAPGDIALMQRASASKSP